MGKLTPFIASIILGAVALIYYLLVAKYYSANKRLELKHKTWLRLAIIFTIIAVGVALLNLYMGA